MVGTHPVLFCEKSIGTITVEKRGLYYHFSCQCTFPQKGIYRVLALCGQKTVNLGVCVPNGTNYITTAKLPISQFTGKNTRFIITSSFYESAETIPLDSNTPILRLGILRHCRYNTDEEQPQLLYTVKKSV